MTDLRKRLETNLAAIPGVQLSFYKETDLRMLTFDGKDVAHFHNGIGEIDIRIPKRFVKRHQLGEAYRSERHPDRSKNSIWRVFPYRSAADVDQIVVHVKNLLEEEYTT